MRVQVHDSRWQRSVPGADGVDAGWLGSITAAPRLHLRRSSQATTQWMTPPPTRATLSRLRFRAAAASWPGAAGMVVDYLATLPQVDMKHIALFPAIRAMAKWLPMEPRSMTRISAVIPASTGVGGVVPWRLLRRARNAGESIETTTRSFPHLVHPRRLRFFLRPRRSPAHRWQPAHRVGLRRAPFSLNTGFNERSFQHVGR